jgi:galactofuranose transport system ATP-binding protein
MAERAPIVELKKINKNFPGVRALYEVDFRLFPGEVHALMGQNGAGKSTLVKVLTGVYKQDSGEMLLEGKPIRPDTPLAAQKLGINTVYQEVNLCLNLSVAENIFIGREPIKFGKIDWKTMHRRSAEILGRLNIKIDVTRTLSTFSLAIQQMVAIARVLDSSSKVLILDEPTSSLSPELSRAVLRDQVRRLADSGTAVLLVEQKAFEALGVSDWAYILVAGRVGIDGRASEIVARPDIREVFLGQSAQDASPGSPEHDLNPQPRPS